MTRLLPKRLKKGDLVGISSPSAPITDELTEKFEKGIEFLKNQGLRVKVSPNAHKNTLKYSATVEEKAEDLNKLIKDKSVKAIFFSQGGNNANSTLRLIDYEEIEKNPKIFFGISDLTVLLNAITKKTDLVTFHGNDVIWGFGRGPHKHEEKQFSKKFFKGELGKIEKNSKWKEIRGGKGTGILSGGNLNCLNKLAGTEFFPDFRSKILFLESFGETNPPDLVEAELYRLKQIGVFDIIEGLWLGFYEHEKNIDYEDIVLNVVKDYDFPIIKCDDFGHDTANTIIPIGTKAHLDADKNEITLLQDYVR